MSTSIGGTDCPGWLGTTGSEIAQCRQMRGGLPGTTGATMATVPSAPAATCSRERNVSASRNTSSPSTMIQSQSSCKAARMPRLNPPAGPRFSPIESSLTFGYLARTASEVPSELPLSTTITSSGRLVPENRLLRHSRTISRRLNVTTTAATRDAMRNVGSSPAPAVRANKASSPANRSRVTRSDAITSRPRRRRSGVRHFLEKRADGSNAPGLLVRGQSREDGQRKHFPARLLRYRDVSPGIAQPTQGRLLVHRERIMHCRFHAPVFQKVAHGVTPARGDPRVQVRQLHPQQRGLQGVQPAVGADGLVHILPGGTLGAQQPQPPGQVVIIGDHKPSVPQGAQVLRGVQTEAPQVADGAHLLPPELGAHRLGGIFDHEEPMLPGQREEGSHICRLPEEMYRDEGLDGPRPEVQPLMGSRAPRQHSFHRIRIQIECLWIDIGEDGLSPGMDNGADRPEEREGGRQDPVARADAERLKGQP